MLDSLAPLCQCAAEPARAARPSTQRVLTMANPPAEADKLQHHALMSAIQRHEPIDQWVQDEHRGLLSMGSTDLGWTPLVCAARHGNAGATALLLEAGVDADQRTNSGFCPLFISCWNGNIPCAQLLSSHGANRVFSQWDTAERASAHYGHDALTEWLALSREWSPLHHLEVLSPERTRALLRGGADLHLTRSTGNTATPLERARQLAPASASASLVVCAAGPWSTTTHELFGDAERARAVTLAHSLYHVYLRRMEHGGWQAVDFARHVLSHLLCR